MADRADEQYLAFDLGASSGRAILGHIRQDGSIELQEVHRFANTPVTRGAGLFWNVEKLFDEMLRAMRIVADRGIEPCAIGVDTWGVDFALLDDDGELVEPPRCYREPRNAGMSKRLAKRIGAVRLLERTGSMHQDHTSLCQLAAAAEQTGELLDRAELLLFIPDLLRYWLCGGAARADRGALGRVDCTSASTSQMYDVVRRAWAVDILGELHLPAQILPQVLHAPTVVAPLGESVQRRTGLGAIPVVAGAGHDSGAAFGLCRRQDLPPAEDLVVMSSGTWSVLGVFVPEHLPAGSVDPTKFGYEANPDGSLRIVSNLTGGWLIDQCRSAWGAEGDDVTHQALIAAARGAAGTPKASGILDTSWEGFTRPDNMPSAIAAYCRRTNQAVPRTPGQFAQVIFTSLAASYGEAIEDLRAKTGWALGNLYVMGGLSRNEYLNELTAKRAGVKVIVGATEATALGNIMVQRQALGR